MSRHVDAPTVRPMKFGLSQDLRAAASQLSSATLHEAAQKIGAMPSAIKPLDPRMKCVGPALTVHSPPGDNLWLHRALDVAQPGDVMVVFASGAYEYGYWGEIMSTMAMARGLAGLVIDGCVRDGALLREMGWPVFSRGLCIQGTGKDFGATGWINHPVSIGPLVIQPGDLVVGDADGVMVVPQDRAAQIVDAGQRRDRQEAEILERLRRGESTLSVYGWN